MHGLPVPAAVSEVLPLFKQRLHQRTANAGVAVGIDSVGEPRARHADLLAVLPLDHAVVSVAPFLHCQHRFPASTDVLAEKWCEAVGRLSVIRFVMLAVLEQAPGGSCALEACCFNRWRLFPEGSFSVCKEVKYLCAPADSLFVELRVTALGA